jgi:hypothetical protein
MPGNRGTRRGNGAGHGGPAKGEGFKLKPKGDPTSDAIRAQGTATPPGTGKKSVADLMAAAGARELAAQRWLEILNDPAHPHHANMVAKAAERMDGAPVQQLTGADGAPLTFQIVTGVPRDEAAAD